MIMINRLFSSFDPLSGIKLINYLSLLPIFACPIVLNFYFIAQSRNIKFTKYLYTYVNGEMSRAVTNQYKLGKINILIALFFFIMLINLSGLIPYVFTRTAHIIITLSLAFPLWLGFTIFGLTINTNHFFSHLVPLSTPMALSQFIVLIERVRQLIRPVTLSVRLAANMTAGHILITLASRNIAIINRSSVVLIALLVLETAVAFIQRYVLTILLSMYINER